MGYAAIKKVSNCSAKKKDNDHDKNKVVGLLKRSFILPENIKNTTLRDTSCFVFILNKRYIKSKLIHRTKIGPRKWAVIE